MRTIINVRRIVSHGSSTVVVDDDCDSNMSWDGTDHVVDNNSLSEDGIPGSYELMQICDAFERGVKMTRRKQHLRHKHHVFTGYAAIDFLVNNGYAKSREQALKIGRLMAYDYALYRHETNDFDLEDNKNLYYVFTTPSQRIIHSAEYSSYSLNDMLETFEGGILVDSQKRFEGCAAVDYLVNNRCAKTRQDAVRIGQLLMDAGLFEHIARKHKFKDKNVLYQLVTQKPHKQQIQDCHNISCPIPIEEVAQCLQTIIQPGHVFSGSSAVDAIVETKLADTRSKAIEVLQKLSVDMQLFECCEDRASRAFLDRTDVYYKYCRRSESLEWLDKDSALDYLDELGITVSESDRSISQQVSKDDGECDCEDNQEPSKSIYFDRFGFILEGKEDDACDASVDSHDTWNDTVEGIENELSIADWRMLLDRCASTDSPGESPSANRNTVKHYMRTGSMPDSFRRQAWTSITGVDAVVRERKGDYQSLVKTATRLMENENEPSAVQGVIERDLRRTFPRHYLFCNTDSTEEDCTPEGLESLRRVLYAYSIYDDEVGYCQGMNFISAMLLTFTTEEEAFWLLVAVMSEKPYCLRNMFKEDMSGVHECLFVAEKLIKKFLPALHGHLDKEHIDISMFATSWLMTVFASTFPFDLVSVVWDSFIVEGSKVVYRVMLALLEQAQDELLNLDMEEILCYLRDDIRNVDGRTIMRNSLKISLRQRHIKKYINEWRSSQKGKTTYRRLLSNNTESEESTGSRIVEGVTNGKHIAKKLLPASLSRRASL